jgi:hypothetical protein
MNAVRKPRFMSRSLGWLLVGLFALAGPVLLSGCSSGGKDQAAPTTTAEEKALIAAQGSCPISGERLDSMGKPVKVMVNGEPVFLCCGSCKKKALADPEKTLARVKELKEKK